MMIKIIPVLLSMVYCIILFPPESSSATEVSGDGNISLDPGFRDPERLDFRLM